MLNPHSAPHPTGPRQLQLIEGGTADLISYGALFLANPDLPRRLTRGEPTTPLTATASTAAPNLATPTSLSSPKTTSPGAPSTWSHQG